MYLKRVEMFGFKSFADRLELIFQPGITSVVGPNGSGKSNIADAIRWVLGEQSLKSIRSHKQEDVIFNGSENRKPLGMAEVMLVLDNEDRKLSLDFAEIAVMRRVYRSGESEYFINKSHVRLREIQELFYDTGLGKEAYSIIGQGKIDAILSAKAEERRSILEEAAGIVKYKHKKAVALQKLQDADQNLIRVGDIIHEISGQLEPVAGQAAVAEKYLQLWEELRGLEINLYGRELLKWEKQIQDCGQEKESLAEDLKNLQIKGTALQGKQAALKLELVRLDEELGRMNQAYYNVCTEEERINSSIRVVEERLKTAELQVRGLEEEETVISTKKIVQEKELAALDEKATATRLRVADLQTSTADQGQKWSLCQGRIAELEKEIESYKEEIIENLNRVAGIRNEQNKRHLAAEYVKKQIDEKNIRKQKCRDEYDRIERLLTEIENSLISLNQNREKLHREKSSLRIQLAENESALAKTRDALMNAKQKKAAYGARLDAMERMEHEYDGYAMGVKHVMGAETQPFRRGVVGTVAQLFSAQHGYEVALDTVLGHALQDVVVENDQIAQQAISYLKQSQSGRVTFLPLNLMETRRPPEALSADLLSKHELVAAETVFTGEARLQKIVRYLLGNVLIAPDLKIAMAAFHATKRQFRLVTLEGDLLLPGGAISGGGRALRQAGLLERKAEFKRIRTDADILEREIADLIITVSSLENCIADLAGRLNEITVRLQEQEIKAAGLTGESERWQNDLARWGKELEVLEFELSDLAREQSGLVEKTKTEESDLADSENARAALEAGLSECEQNLKSARKEHEDLLHQLGDDKALLAAACQEEMNLKQLCANLKEQLNELEHQSASNRELKQKLLADMAGMKNDLNVYMEAIGALILKRDQEIAEIEKLKALKTAMQDDWASLEGDEEEWRKTVKEKEERSLRLELKVSQLALQTENHHRYLAENYGEDWRAKFCDGNGESVANAKSRISELKAEMKAMGNVNTGAIDEYQRLKERYIFLQRQQEDLLQAKESLLEVISEIEGTTTERFLETFVKVREEFQYIFSHLFDGGKADLLLSEPERPLESGIEIFAQPPGKRLQNLLSLSGGERAMTAISLLFAILKVKPTPFCVLDEIDATLDEVNVQRFADLLVEFSEKIQFVVITHRRGTMEMSNALYGASMEERGVSKLISIKLAENEKTKAS
ncbi:MAG: chromosome segregation protein SMC [Bacillota bacterium]